MAKQRRSPRIKRIQVTASNLKSRMTANGYSADAAWELAMKPGGAQSVVDLEGGGYAVPLERNEKIAPPSKTIPILARVPSGVVSILPGPYAWRIVGKG